MESCQSMSVHVSLVRPCHVRSIKGGQAKGKLTKPPQQWHPAPRNQPSLQFQNESKSTTPDHTLARHRLAISTGQSQASKQTNKHTSAVSIQQTLCLTGWMDLTILIPNSSSALPQLPNLVSVLLFFTHLTSPHLISSHLTTSSGNVQKQGR